MDNRQARRIVEPWQSLVTDPAAKRSVSQLLDEFGFDAVDAGPLKEGWRIQRDTPGYGPRRTAEELRKDLAAAKRYKQ
jgi:8-hydroxy-5-deazaflavin:NADPH oxidoreductase